MQENYKTSLAAVLRYEGGYSNHPSDPGGATLKGVTQATYNSWRNKKGLPTQSVRLMSDDELQQIYRRDYWDRVRGDDLPSGLDLCVFDLAVNSGVSRAIKMLQKTLGVTADGVIGPQTLVAARANPKAHLALCDARLNFMKGLSTWPVFGKGWGSRVADVRKKGAVLAAKAPTRPTVVAKAAPHEEKSILDGISDFFDWTRPSSQVEPPSTQEVLKAEKTKIASAIVAALGALSVLDWDVILANPKVGYTLIVGALVTSVGHTYLPSFLWWLLPKGQTA